MAMGDSTKLLISSPKLMKVIRALSPAFLESGTDQVVKMSVGSLWS